MKYKRITYFLAAITFTSSVMSKGRVETGNSYVESGHIDSSAKHTWLAAPWGKLDSRVATTGVYPESSEDQGVWFEAKISNQSNGDKRLYFQISSPSFNVCDSTIHDENKYLYNEKSHHFAKLEVDTWSINGNDFDVIYFCSFYTDNKKHMYLSVTPIDDQELNLVINEILQSKGSTHISGSTTEIKFSIPINSAGFEKAWREF